MKNLVSFATLLIFLHITTFYMIVTEAKEGLPDPVLDTEGDELQAGNSYYIRPVFSGMGGGLVAQQTKGVCVFAVAQHKSDTEPGQPLTLLPDGFQPGDRVYESTDLNIGFSISYGCRPSSIWKVDKNDKSVNQYFVMLGGVVGNPGNETVSNWFKIEKVAPRDYKIVFCPSVCELCTVPCSDVGIYVEKGVRRLSLSDVPLYVRFQKIVMNHKKY